jgi:hypothetical protein
VAVYPTQIRGHRKRLFGQTALAHDQTFVHGGLIPVAEFLHGHSRTMGCPFLRRILTACNLAEQSHRLLAGLLAG